MTPLERAARALYDREPQTMDVFTRDCADPKSGVSVDTRPISWDDLGDEDKVSFVKAARAVLTAILEPSGSVANAGGASFAGQFTDPWDALSPEEEEALGLEVDGDDAFVGANERLAPYAAESWTAMFDAALTEGE